jgi:Skp family chaperone for outer membrane proteins
MTHAALLAASLACLVLTAAPAVAAPDGVAVVDMVDLLNHHPRLKELDRRFEGRQKAAQEYAQREQEQLQKLQAEIELMERNDPVRRQKEKQLLASSAMLKFEIEWRKNEALREYMEGLQALYMEIASLVARFARENRLGIVLLRPPAELEAEGFEAFVAQVQLRGVVYHDTAMDITDRIKALFPPRTAPGG